ncbi:MAG TPA: hypothetical protein VE033_18590 [Acetobacteraceae bacterium]|jgi:hypothetical protein|nr:hypothetical protein [Acetobacteraceae bacterium]
MLLCRTVTTLAGAVIGAALTVAVASTAFASSPAMVASAMPVAADNPEAEATYLRTCEARAGGGQAGFCLASLNQLKAELGPDGFDAHVQEIAIRDCTAALDWMAAEQRTGGVLLTMAQQATEACFNPPALMLEMGFVSGR